MARREGAGTPVPVVYVDLSEDEERTVLATLDPIGGMAVGDEAALAALVRTIEDGDLRSVAGTMAQTLGVAVEGKGEAVGDVAPQVDRAEELRAKWGVEPGQLWELGAHRLICGDCTDGAVVARLMGGEKAEMVWTDPPYGVAVGDKNKYLKSIARSNRIEENLQNDTLDEPGLLRMLAASFDNAMAHCRAGAAWYVAAPAGPLHVLFGQCLKDRGIWRQTIQWVKNWATISPMGVCYHWQAEPIFFGWLPDGGHRWYGGRKQTTVWEIDRPTKSPEHPTMKPVELVARAVENSSLPGEIVYEPFSGSGTTLMACEALGRRCRAVEIAPGYVAVALERWATATGKRPVLVEG
jgi:site-specific DNA-methyltransferase (adenine-specific)